MACSPVSYALDTEPEFKGSSVVLKRNRSGASSKRPVCIMPGLHCERRLEE